MRFLCSLAMLSWCACAPPAKPLVADRGAPIGPEKQFVIGMTGGSFTHGSLTVTIPSGAVSRDVTFSATPLESTAPGARLEALRLGPEGTTFSQPVTLTFTYADAQLSGTSPEALAIAYQHGSGFWALAGEVTLDTTAKTISVKTTHFSDWSMVTGVQLTPRTAKVKKNGTVTLEAKRCYAKADGVDVSELELVPLGYPCESTDDDTVALPSETSEWSVNGILVGTPDNGIVRGELSRGVYEAPPDAPETNPVAVSARLKWDRGVARAVSNIEVESNTLKVEATYEKSKRLFVPFVEGDLRDPGFVLTVPFPVDDGNVALVDNGRASVTALRDTRSGCVSPSLASWDEFRADSAEVTGSYLIITGEVPQGDVTVGVGEGDCAVDTRVEKAKPQPGTLMVEIPASIFTAPALPNRDNAVVVTVENWTYRFYGED